MIAAWHFLFIPFVEKNEKIKADLLLSPYAPMFEQLIDDQYFHDLDIVISTLMLLKDEDNNQPLILSLEVNLTDKRIIKQSNNNRTSRFINTIPLFSPTSFELLGNLKISYNDYTYNKTVENSLKIILGAIFFFSLLFFIGQQLLSRFIKPLTSLSKFLANNDSLNIDALPKQKPGLSEEIKSMWDAAETMLERIKLREIELNEKHEITQKALKDKIEAESASKTKSMFLANMSHEIRTPLTAIIGFADALQDKSVSQEHREKARNTIVRNGRHLLGIINDILDLSKIESGRLQVEKIPVSPLQLIADVESVFESQITKNGLDFVLNYQFPIPKLIVSDPTRIRQILFNLLSNANKFTEDGNVRLSTEFDEKSNKLRITVTDTGIGLSTEQTNRIFNPFSQADLSTTRKFGGTGLGLTISRRLAHLLGGDLEVCSIASQGTAFTLTLDAGEVDAMYTRISQFQYDGTVQEEVLDVSEIAGNILIVEDTKDIQDLVTFYLQQTSINITYANNGQEALDLVLTQEFDLILMDIQMPVMDGITATKKLRALNFKKTIIALTANAMREDRDKYDELGMNEFIAKPIDKKRLYKALEKHLPKIEKKVEITREEKALKKRKTQEKLTRKFIERLPNWMNDISAALDKNDKEALCKASHVLKGLGGSFGFPEITEISAKIELAGKAEDFESALINYSNLKSFCENNIK